MLWLYILPIILSSSLKPFFYKTLTKYINNIDILLIIHIFYHIFVLSLCSYIILFDLKKGIEFIERIKKLPTKMYFVFGGIVALSIISSLMYYYLLKRTEINRLTHIIRGGSAILMIIFSYLFYKDIISFYKAFGIGLILVGIYFVNNF